MSLLFPLWGLFFPANAFFPFVRWLTWPTRSFFFGFLSVPTLIRQIKIWIPPPWTDWLIGIDRCVFFSGCVCVCQYFKQAPLDWIKTKRRRALLENVSLFPGARFCAFGNKSGQLKCAQVLCKQTNFAANYSFEGKRDLLRLDWSNFFWSPVSQATWLMRHFLRAKPGNKHNTNCKIFSLGLVYWHTLYSSIHQCLKGRYLQLQKPYSIATMIAKNYIENQL